MNDQIFIGFHHYALRSADLPGSIRFFEALGFRQVHEWALPQYGIVLAVMMQVPDNSSWIELFNLDADIPLQGTGGSVGENIVTGALAHICLTVTDLEKASARIVEAGAKHLHGPETLSLGRPEVLIRNAIFLGPAGEAIELLQQVRFPGDLSKSAHDR